jgi:hypothetical protein
MQTNKLEFRLAIPQGWRGGNLPLEEENNPVKQYEFSKSISATADSIGFDSIYVGRLVTAILEFMLAS